MEPMRRDDWKGGDVSLLSRGASCRVASGDKSPDEKAVTSHRTPKDARRSRSFGRASRVPALFVSLLVGAALLGGCREQRPAVEEKAPAAAEKPVSAREWFEQTTREFHGPSAEARGPERERLLKEAARRYAELLRQFPAETNLCAQSLRALGSIHATQGNTNEAVKLYAAVGEQYASQDREVLMAWKAAADLLRESGRRDEAKKFYAKIVERFGKKNAPQIIQQVVRGSQARLAE